MEAKRPLDQTAEEALQEALAKSPECQYLPAPRFALGVEVNGKFAQLPVEPAKGRGRRRPRTPEPNGAGGFSLVF